MPNMSDRVFDHLLRQAERCARRGEPLPADVHAALIAEGIDASLYEPTTRSNEKDFEHG